MTELQLYKFVQDKEIHWRGDKLLLWIPFYDLSDFTSLVGVNYFSEGGEPVYLQSETVCIELNDLCECMDIKPENILEREPE